MKVSNVVSGGVIAVLSTGSWDTDKSTLSFHFRDRQEAVAVLEQSGFQQHGIIEDRWFGRILDRAFNVDICPFYNGNGLEGVLTGRLALE